MDDWHAPTWAELSEIDNITELRRLRVRCVDELGLIDAQVRLLSRSGQSGGRLNSAKAARLVHERCITAISVRLNELGEEFTILPSYGSILVLERATAALRSIVELTRSLCDDVIKIDAAPEDEIPDVLITLAAYKAGQLRTAINLMLADEPTHGTLERNQPNG